jgi:hypothetical protein
VPDVSALRTRADVEAEHQRLQREHSLRRLPRQNSHDPNDMYTIGQITALAWILGLANEAPLTGAQNVDVTDTWAVANEQYLATNMLQGRVPLDRRGRSYAVGVEHALMWVRGQTNSEL